MGREHDRERERGQGREGEEGRAGPAHGKVFRLLLLRKAQQLCVRASVCVCASVCNCVREFRRVERFRGWPCCWILCAEEAISGSTLLPASRWS